MAEKKRILMSEGWIDVINREARPRTDKGLEAMRENLFNEKKEFSVFEVGLPPDFPAIEIKKFGPFGTEEEARKILGTKKIKL